MHLVYVKKNPISNSQTYNNDKSTIIAKKCIQFTLNNPTSEKTIGSTISIVLKYHSGTPKAHAL